MKHNKNKIIVTRFKHLTIMVMMFLVLILPYQLITNNIKCKTTKCITIECKLGNNNICIFACSSIFFSIKGCACHIHHHWWGVIFHSWRTPNMTPYIMTPVAEQERPTLGYIVGGARESSISLWHWRKEVMAGNGKCCQIIDIYARVRWRVKDA